MAKADARHIEIGISEEHRAQIAAELSTLLADTYTMGSATGPRTAHNRMKGSSHQSRRTARYPITPASAP